MTSCTAGDGRQRKTGPEARLRFNLAEWTSIELASQNIPENSDSVCKLLILREFYGTLVYSHSEQYHPSAARNVGRSVGGKSGGEMSTAIHRLTARAVESRSRPGYYPDGAGLYLQVAAAAAPRNRPTKAPPVTRSWIFRYTLDKRAHEMGIGSARVIGLAEARAKAAECRRLIIDGKDPIDERSAARLEATMKSTAKMTFDQCATAYIAAHRDGWRNSKHAAQWENTLRLHASPVVGALPVSDIALPQIMKILEPI